MNDRKINRYWSLCSHRKYVPWKLYLPNVVAFHTPLSKYLTVIVMTLN